MDINTAGRILSPVYASETGILNMEYLNEIIRFDLVKIIQM